MVTVDIYRKLYNLGKVFYNKHKTVVNYTGQYKPYLKASSPHPATTPQGLTSRHFSTHSPPPLSSHANTERRQTDKRGATCWTAGPGGSTRRLRAARWRWRAAPGGTLRAAGSAAGGAGAVWLRRGCCARAGRPDDVSGVPPRDAVFLPCG